MNRFVLKSLLLLNLLCIASISSANRMPDEPTQKKSVFSQAKKVIGSAVNKTKNAYGVMQKYSPIEPWKLGVGVGMYGYCRESVNGAIISGARFGKHMAKVVELGAQTASHVLSPVGKFVLNNRGTRYLAGSHVAQVGTALFAGMLVRDGYYNLKYIPVVLKKLDGKNRIANFELGVYPTAASLYGWHQRNSYKVVNEPRDKQFLSALVKAIETGQISIAKDVNNTIHQNVLATIAQEKKELSGCISFLKSFFPNRKLMVPLVDYKLHEHGWDVEYKKAKKRAGAKGNSYEWSRDMDADMTLQMERNDDSCKYRCKTASSWMTLWRPYLRFPCTTCPWSSHKAMDKLWGLIKKMDRLKRIEFVVQNDARKGARAVLVKYRVPANNNGE